MSDVIEAVTLERAKAYLRVDYSSDDELISGLIAAATSRAEHICGREIVKRADENALAEKVEQVPEAIATWVLMNVADYYEHRGASESGIATGRRFYDHLLDKYRRFGDV